MARTKASVGSKVAAGKSSKARCSAAPPPSSYVASSSGERSARNHSGGNSVCPRETPKWQKPITNFFIGKDTSQSSTEENGIIDEVAAGSSKQKQKRNVIQSDTEESPEKAKIPDLDTQESPEKAKNTVLDDTIELEPLTGEDSHKIEEYYQKGAKGKGIGKKTKGKENMDNNERKAVKRDRDDGVSETDSVCKKIKV